MKKFPSIEQFRNIIREVRLSHDYKGKDENGNAIYFHDSNYPVLNFTGTVKLHGTNAGIVLYKDGHIEYQSRERVLSLDADNSGFMYYMSNIELKNLFEIITSFDEYIAIYGEWCGGSIQKGVALNQLEKMFVIFGLKVDDKWIELPIELQDNSKNIFNIKQFPTYEIQIDFNNPELIQNDLIDLTLSVENECPVGKYFGVSGVGEGIVFTCDTNPNWKFKSKGEKHSVSKVKKLNTINTEEINSINEFIEYAVTNNRLEQGIKYLKELNIEIDTKNIGSFLQWVVKDILKEEGDTIIKNELDDKKIKAAIVNKSKQFFLTYINKV